jgi:hypothetical protein
MTSSATPTDEKPEPRDEGDQPRKASWIGWLAVALLLAVGWILILRVNRWHIGPPVVFLSLGWLAVLLTARYLLTAGWLAANDDPDELGEFWQPVGAREELEREKRSLLKAIKEIEFDHEMGKMSDADAEELIHFYRTRAIEVIKALDVAGPEAGMTVQQRIDREVRARLAVSTKPVERAAAVSAAPDSKEAEAAAQVAAGAAPPIAAETIGTGDVPVPATEAATAESAEEKTP